MDEIKKLLHIFIMHADAAQGYILTDGRGIIGAVDAVTRQVQAHPAAAIDLFAVKLYFTDDSKLARRGGRGFFAHGTGPAIQQPAVVTEGEKMPLSFYVDI